MCEDGILSKSSTAAWEFLEDLAKKENAMGDH